jgi:hypothetical protein
MVKLSAVAKLTHSQYGIRRTPAAGEIFQKDIRVAIMAAHKGTISSKPANGFLSPKKRGDHAALRAN